MSNQQGNEDREGAREAIIALGITGIENPTDRDVELYLAARDYHESIKREKGMGVENWVIDRYRGTDDLEMSDEAWTLWENKEQQPTVIHAKPVKDSIEHVNEVTCGCNPDAETHAAAWGDVTVYEHHAMDGRPE